MAEQEQVKKDKPITDLDSLKAESAALKGNVQQLGVNSSLDTVVSGAIKAIEKSLADLKQKQQAIDNVKSHASNVIKDIKEAFPNNDSKGPTFDGSFDNINKSLKASKKTLDNAPGKLATAQNTLQTDKIALTQATQGLTDAQNAFANYVKNIQTQIDLINKYCVGAMTAVDNGQSTEAYIYTKMIEEAKTQLAALTSNETLAGFWTAFDKAYKNFSKYSDQVANDQAAVTVAQDVLKAAKPDYDTKLASFIQDVINNVPPPPKADDDPVKKPDPIVKLEDKAAGSTPAGSAAANTPVTPA